MRLSIMGAALGRRRGVPSGLGVLAAGRLGPGVLLPEKEEAARRGAHAAGRPGALTLSTSGSQ